MNLEELKFDENGLIPAVVQDRKTKEVLTLAYMNSESLSLSIESGETWFYSRSRQELWHKGATSGNTQRIAEIKYDCDQDALVVLVEPAGPACHTGAVSCFNETVYQAEELTEGIQDSYSILAELERVIEQREIERPEGAYTTYLFEKGVDKILKKVGEESAEVIIAAKNRDQEELKWESADLLYHLLVLLREQKLPFEKVLGVLKERHEKG
ncbi:MULTISPECIES: bifunctional phosphoribosyl-AMP cyclohydrolase/phosphoribosyl-ATP diphosphatase HisIE [Bacillaceae]|uniref:bifunctional phosphoribosyl-AMP cyclohydrolase/phosphoribosyl-ATP diphosphatase HisIE n=1 Tax=Bacillaceae TaxID=186817 RepID=UPI0029652285|nr:bifunctional phosphoribosyl-AMP cyclohydrolase/phosphoribosyl-ATP diphosphatase HisIE [Bacillus infantis]MDW2879320.1 bifunctional phosphoribosyl-AMP cyclohydrolase/phosphoribosyl-ATP diphosphatase HisIE [Bacillus infantis]